MGNMNKFFNEKDQAVIQVLKSEDYFDIYCKVVDKIREKFLPPKMDLLCLTFTDTGVLANFIDPPSGRCIFVERQIITKIIRWRQLEK